MIILSSHTFVTDLDLEVKCPFSELTPTVWRCCRNIYGFTTSNCKKMVCRHVAYRTEQGMSV